MTRKGFLAGLGAGVIAIAIMIPADLHQRRTRTARTQADLDAVQLKLESYPEERLMVARFELLSERCRRTADILDHLTTRRVDAVIIDEAASSAASLAEIQIQWVEWIPDGVHITILATNVEPLVLFAEQLEDHPNLRAVEIQRWKDEENPDRFVIRAQWVPARKHS